MDGEFVGCITVAGSGWLLRTSFPNGGRTVYRYWKLLLATRFCHDGQSRRICQLSGEDYVRQMYRLGQLIASLVLPELTLKLDDVLPR
jgi:hypothetical protein